jgi:hypothetical protein
MMKSKMANKRQKLPTEEQTRVLRRIAQNGGSIMLTRDAEKGNRYHDLAGVTIAEPTARILIRNGWVIAQKDSLFDLDSQTWRVRR